MHALRPPRHLELPRRQTLAFSPRHPFYVLSHFPARLDQIAIITGIAGDILSGNVRKYAQFTHFLASNRTFDRTATNRSIDRFVGDLAKTTT